MDNFMNLLDIPLDDQELTDLIDFLESIPGAMSIEMMDGFFAALVCSPDLLWPGNYIMYIFGEGNDHNKIEDAKLYLNLIIRHWNSISKQLRESDIFDPVIMDSEDKPAGYDWASGFLMGMRLGGTEWNSYLQDDEHAGVFIPIFMLFHENDPDPALRPDPISDEQREKLFAGISVGVPKMYAYMAPFRHSKSIGAKRPVTLPRTTQKIGRNDPCPCKSGLKYKKCCGKH